MLSRVLSGGALAVAALGVVACGDTTSSSGEEGRLIYSLHTEYDVPERELTDARIVTGHQQRITVRFTREGRREVESAEGIVHSVLPATGVTAMTSGGTMSDPPDLSILVTEPGELTIESRDPMGALVDRIRLEFETPGGFELVTQARGPWADDFSGISGDPIAVEEGTQVTFQAVPTDAAGARLAGDLTTDLSVDPEWAVVPGMGVIHAWEGGVWTVGGEVSFYFIDPALVTFTVTDGVSGATGAQVFDVAPITRP